MRQLITLHLLTDRQIAGLGGWQCPRQSLQPLWQSVQTLRRLLHGRAAVLQCYHSILPLKRDRHGTVVALVASLHDKDSEARKFAAFALGNAAFHSDLLYSQACAGRSTRRINAIQLAASIAPLVLLLGDASHKTQANAAGALGNLARSSGELAHALVNAGT